MRFATRVRNSKKGNMYCNTKKQKKNLSRSIFLKYRSRFFVRDAILKKGQCMFYLPVIIISLPNKIKKKNLVVIIYCYSLFNDALKQQIVLQRQHNSMKLHMQYTVQSINTNIFFTLSQ